MTHDKLNKVTVNVIFTYFLRLTSGFSARIKIKLGMLRHYVLKVIMSNYFHILLIAFLVTLLRLIIIPYPSPEKSPEDCMRPSQGCGFIFDEAYYVPAARELIQGRPANNEHPPLAKVMIMLGMLVLGDNPYGWRIPIVITSGLSVLMVGMIAYNLTRSNFISLTASLLFATDIHSFNIGSIAMLDAPALSFMLIASYLLIKGRIFLSSLVIGLSFLTKVASVFATLGLILFLLFRSLNRFNKFKEVVKDWYDNFERISFISLATFLVGLYVYDYYYSAFPTPLDHISYMVNYQTALKYDDPEEVIFPLDWINPFSPFSPIPYHVVTKIVDGNKLHPIAYYGLQTPLWWTTWVVMVFSSYSLARGLIKKSMKDSDAFVVSWLLLNYIPYFFIAYMLKRWVYPFYFYFAVPSLAIGIPSLLKSDGKIRYVVYFIIAVQAFWFFVWFPVKNDQYLSFLNLVGLPA